MISNQRLIPVATVLLAALLSLTGCNNDGGSPDGGGGGTAGGGAGGGSGGGSGGGGGASTANFSLSANPTSISVGQGGVANIAINISRTNGDTNAIALSITGAPTGVTATLSPTSVPNGSDQSMLSLTVAASAAVSNTAMLNVIGTDATGTANLLVPLSITAPVDILLVDDDLSDNNNGASNPTPSADDTLFANLLTTGAIPYNTYVVPNGANGPTAAQMQAYKTVIWYCGSNYGGGTHDATVSGTDEIQLTNYLNQGGRKVIIFAASYLYQEDDTATWTSTASTFVSGILGEQGFEWDKLNEQAYDATGAGPFAGLTLNIANDSPDTTYTDPVNPATGTDVFFTAQIEVVAGNGAIAAPIATGRKGIGTAGTSKAILFSFPFPNVVDGIGTNTKATVFTGLLAY